MWSGSRKLEVPLVLHDEGTVARDEGLHLHRRDADGRHEAGHRARRHFPADAAGEQAQHAQQCYYVLLSSAMSQHAKMRFSSTE